MNNSKTLLTFFVALATLTASAHSESVRLYVSKNGADQWSGQLADPNASNTDGPLATLEAAQARVRFLLKEQTAPIEVFVRGGTYRLEKPLVLTPDDSGKQQMPVIWTSHEGERVVISGGRQITGWKKVTDTLPGLPRNAAGHVWYVDLPEGTRFCSLFNDSGVLPQAISGRLETDKDESAATSTRMKWEGSDLDRLNNVNDAMLHILPKVFFIYNILPVKSLDKANKVLETKIASTSNFPLYTQLGPFGKHCYYRIANVIEFLDEPGKWVINTREGRLYYWPISGDRPGDDVCYPVMDELISFRGNVERRDWVRNIHLRGLTLRNTERMLTEQGQISLMAGWDVFEGSSAVVHLRGAQHITIDNCIIENSGGTGIRGGIYAANNTFTHNVIRNMGLSGITLIGHGPGRIADNHDNAISHNHISYCGEIWGCGIGILLCGSGYNHVHNNLIHHTANHSIAMIGSFDEWWDLSARAGRPYLRFDDLHVPPERDEWYLRRAYIQVRHNLVEYNEVHHTGHGDKMADINCLYIHGSGDGNVYRRNYLHDADGSGVHSGIRTDGWQFFARISENVIMNINAPGITLKQINDYDNNILVNCERAAFLFKLIWSAERKFPLYGCNMRRNIMVQAMSSTEEKRLVRIGPFYSAPRYPDPLIKQPMADNNVFFVAGDSAAGDEALARARALGLDPNSVAGDPMFVDMEKGDFRFKDGSPALRLGITPITKYGIQEPYGLTEDFAYTGN